MFCCGVSLAEARALLNLDELLECGRGLVWVMSMGQGFIVVIGICGCCGVVVVVAECKCRSVALTL